MAAGAIARPAFPSTENRWIAERSELKHDCKGCATDWYMPVSVDLNKSALATEDNDGKRDEGNGAGEESLGGDLKEQPTALSPKSVSCCHLDAILEDCDDSNADSWPWDLTEPKNNDMEGGDKTDRAETTAEKLVGTFSGLRMRVVYRECKHNQAASMGGQAFDGCGEFLPAGEEGTPEANCCAACECHRNFHRRVLEMNEGPAFLRDVTAAVHAGNIITTSQDGGGELMPGTGSVGTESRRKGKASVQEGGAPYLAQVTRLAVEALQHNTKVMVATAENLARLQQQRGPEVREIMYAFSRAAAALGSDLRRRTGLAEAQPEPAPYLGNRLGPPDPPVAAKAMDSSKSTAGEEEARWGLGTDLNIEGGGHVSDACEMGIDGATSTMLETAYHPQNELSDDVLLGRSNGGLNGSWNDGHVRLFGGHQELGGTVSNERPLDLNGHQMMQLPGTLGSLLQDSEAMVSEMIMDCTTVHSSEEERGEGALSISYNATTAVHAEVRRASPTKQKTRPRRGQHGKPKRIRTKLTREQKEKMELYADRVGWTVLGQRKEEVEAACADIGIGLKTLRYWLHNTKQKMKQPQSNAGDVTQIGSARSDSGQMSGEAGKMGASRVHVFGLQQVAHEGSQTWRGQSYQGYEDGLGL